MTEIMLTDSRRRRKVAFRPLDPGDVRLYVCGPTVYDRAHLGNARPVVVFDVLFRLLRHVYGADHVTYVRNITDVDDKIITRAHERGVPIDEVTETTLAWFRQDMGELGALAPTHEPRATAHIPAMIAMIERLIARGCAYAAEGHVLFDVSAFPDYGALSGRSTEDMIAGARVEVAPYKRDPMDFVLWKPAAEGEPGWDSPWGRGRPGWHIECSAMSRELLGESFDIHGGGADLMFPHHENEIAQSRCAHPEADFARLWMHNEMVRVGGQKMAKSLGNFTTVRELLDSGVPGEVIRFVILSTHYRKPMDWTEEKVREAQTALRKWRDLVAEAAPGSAPSPEIVSALADDLNTPSAISILHELFKAGDAEALRSSAAVLGLLKDSLSGWWLPPVKGELSATLPALTASADVTTNDPPHVALIQELLKERQAARASKAFARADRIRDHLVNAGVVIKDTPSGAKWELGHDFDPSKLEEWK